MYLIAYGFYMYHMVSSDNVIFENQKGFAEFSERKKREYIIRESDKLLTNNPKLTSRQIAKKIGYSHSTVCRAFNKKNDNQKKTDKAKDEFFKVIKKQSNFA